MPRPLRRVSPRRHVTVALVASCREPIRPPGRIVHFAVLIVQIAIPREFVQCDVSPHSLTPKQLMACDYRWHERCLCPERVKMGTYHIQHVLLIWVRAIGALLWPIVAAAGVCSLFAALAALAGAGIYGALTARTNVILVVVARLTAVGALTGLIVGVCFSIDRALDRMGAGGLERARRFSARGSKISALNGTSPDCESRPEQDAIARPGERNHRHNSAIKWRRL